MPRRPRAQRDELLLDACVQSIAEERVVYGRELGGVLGTVAFESYADFAPHVARVAARVGDARAAAVADLLAFALLLQELTRRQEAMLRQATVDCASVLRGLPVPDGLDATTDSDQIAWVLYQWRETHLSSRAAWVADAREAFDVLYLAAQTVTIIRMTKMRGKWR